MVDSRKIDDYFDNDKIFADRFASKKKSAGFIGLDAFCKARVSVFCGFAFRGDGGYAEHQKKR